MVVKPLWTTTVFDLTRTRSITVAIDSEVPWADFDDNLNCKIVRKA